MKRGRISFVSRRYVSILTEEARELEGKVATRDTALCPGDVVEYRELERSKARHAEAEVFTVLPRTNCLVRSYAGKTKLLAANIDLLLLVTAPPPLFNAVAVDRTLTACSVEGIRCRLLSNKSDLPDIDAEYQQLLSGYQSMDVEVQSVSAVSGDGVLALKAEVLNNHRVVVLCGVSGVGKSSLLNALIPGAAVRTQQVSAKTGQGRQTTSQAIGHVVKGIGQPLLLVDLPGIQHFGICHLDARQIRESFPEFRDAGCRFADCSHRNEPDCGVQHSLANGQIHASRFQSYMQMLDELERNRAF